MKTKKTALYAAFAVAFGLAVVASPAHADHHEETHTEIRAAVEANDYSMLSDEAKESIDEEDFAEKVEKYAMMQAHQDKIEASIVAQDYEAFAAEVIAHHDMMKEMRDEDDMDEDDMDEDDMDEDDMDEDDMDEDDMEGDDEDGHKMMKKRMMYMDTMSEEDMEQMIKNHYEELVAYYAEHGILPEYDKMKHMWHQGMKTKKWEMTDEMRAEYESKKAAYASMTDEEKMAMKSEMKEKKWDMKHSKNDMKRERKHFKESHRWMVKNVVKMVDTDRLELALKRIDLTLESTSDEKIVDLLEGIKEVIMEVMAG